MPKNENDIPDYGWNLYNRNNLISSVLQQTITAEDKKMKSVDGVTLPPTVVGNPFGVLKKEI